MQKVNALQAFIKTAALSGIAFFLANTTVEAFKLARHIIFTFSEDEKTLMGNSQDDAVFKVVCENCQEHYDDD